MAAPRRKDPGRRQGLRLNVPLVRDLLSISLGAYGLFHFLSSDDSRYWLAMICAGLLVGWLFLPDNFVAKRVGNEDEDKDA